MHGQGTAERGGLSKGGDRRWPLRLNASNVMGKVKIKLGTRISATK